MSRDVPEYPSGDPREYNTIYGYEIPVDIRAARPLVIIFRERIMCMSIQGFASAGFSNFVDAQNIPVQSLVSGWLTTYTKLDSIIPSFSYSFTPNEISPETLLYGLTYSFTPNEITSESLVYSCPIQLITDNQKSDPLSYICPLQFLQPNQYTDPVGMTCPTQLLQPAPYVDSVGQQIILTITQA